MNPLIDTVWQEFLLLLPTEQACVGLIYEHFPENLRQCRNCGGRHIRRDPGDRIGRCLNCKKHVLITARTFFHRVRKVRPWLAALWFFEHGVTVNSNQFAKLLGVAYSSARNIFLRITKIIENHLPADTVSVPGSLFTSVISKRSRLTPANEHPAAEEEDQSAPTNGGKPQDNQPNLVEKPNLVEQPNLVDQSNVVGQPSVADQPAHRNEVEKILLNIISETPTALEQLSQQAEMPIGNVCAALTMLEIDGVIKRLPFDRYVTAAKSAPVIQFSEDIMTAVTSALNFVSRKFHGVSRKCLQLYLAAYWCISDRTRWKHWVLLEACLNDPRDSYGSVEYVSPPLLKVVLART